MDIVTLQALLEELKILLLPLLAFSIWWQYKASTLIFHLHTNDKVQDEKLKNLKEKLYV